MARSIRKRIDIPLLTPRAIRRSIVHRRKIKTSTERAPPVVKISTAMRRTEIATVTIRTDVSNAKYLCKHYFVNRAFVNRDRIAAKHREERDKKDKEEPNLKMNHVINYHYNIDIKSELKEVRFRLRLHFRE